MGAAAARVRRARLTGGGVSGQDMADRTALRDATSVVLVRGAGSGTPAVLMGQRGATAAFMPSKYVFPGGAVDRADSAAALSLPPVLSEKLALRPITPMAPTASALVAAGLRELREETGLTLAGPEAFSFIFRAVTPPRRPRRFDARFLMARAEAILGDPDDFSDAEDELGHLHWVSLDEARALDLPFITEVILAELTAALPRLAPPRHVPFVVNDDTSRIEWL